MTLVRALSLFTVTAVVEIAGCYLPHLWLRKGGSPLLLIPGTASLLLFVWLLSLHPTGAGRTYAASGGVYVFAALIWLWAVEGQRPTQWDVVGAGLALVGMAIIVLGHRSSS